MRRRRARAAHSWFAYRDCIFHMRKRARGIRRCYQKLHNLESKLSSVCRILVRQNPEGCRLRCCVFCHTPLAGSKAKEHVLPRWLERQIGSDILIYYGHPIDGDTGKGFSIGWTETVTATAATRVEGRVCSDCNNTWLSSLEMAAQPVVSPLVSGGRQLAGLSQRDADLLATWLYKTLLVAVSSGSGEFEIHRCDYHAFRVSGRPGDWLNIYAATLETTCGGFCGPAELKWPPIESEPSEEGDRAEPEAIGLKWVCHIGRLHVVMCHSAQSDLVQAVLESVHQPLWSPQPFITIPGALSPEATADSRLQWLAFGLIPYLTAANASQPESA